MAWRYDPRARRYRDDVNGQFISRDRAMEFVGQSLQATGNATDEFARLVSGNRLSPADWREQMRVEIKNEALRQYLLGRGGLEQMSARDWGSVGGMVSEQYRYLDRKIGNFFEQVEAGELSEDETARRARMYINSTREAYEVAQGRRLQGSQYNEEKWFTTSGESCADCENLERLGWIEVGTLPSVPGAGKTACLTNCECYIAYRMAETGEIFGESE